jgi:DNA-binding GntR family transcriptional regulator
LVLKDADRSAQALVYAHLRDRIRNGRLAGGERVVAEVVAASLAVSRMPVREAIAQLASEGLLTIRSHRGAVVTQFSPDELMELFEMRAALEGLAARKAVAALDDDAEDQLFLLLRQLKRAIAVSVDAFIERHGALHAFICATGSGPWLLAETQRLAGAVEPYLRLFFAHHAKAAETFQDHAALVEVLIARDADRAEAAMRNHILSTAPALIAFLRSGGSSMSRETAAMEVL